MASDSTAKTLSVAFILCLVCSILVSTAAVGLKEIQQKNKDLDKKKNILMAAGLYDQNHSVEELFAPIESKVIDLSTGQEVPGVEIKKFDQKKMSKDPKESITIKKENDFAKIKRRSKKALVYFVKKSDSIDQIILPVHGKGLWSTLYGFLSLDKDLNTIRGFAFYQHGETPGLGGEVDNPKWKALWKGKTVYDQSGKVAIAVIKGTVDHSNPANIHKVDGLSGATITSNGVSALLKYWLGSNGFGPFIAKLKSQMGGAM